MKRILSLPIAACVTLSMFWGCTHDKIEISSESVVPLKSEINPEVNVYIENSGSMDGYMSDGSQLKDAIFDYVSDISSYSEKTNLYYINSNVIPFSGKLQQYIKTLNPNSFRKNGGNRSHSDIGQMIETILQNMNDSIVSLFISDCILDLPTADSQKFLNTCQISIKNAINEGRKSIPDLGVEILKMTSDFNGKYFYQNGAIEVLSDVKRPYYIWIMGNNQVLAKLNSEVPISSLVKYGLENYVSFTKMVEIPYEITNKSITSSIINPIKGAYVATLRADFRPTLQPESTIQDLLNYSFNNSSLIIDEIRPITDDNSVYTHYITFTIPKGVKIAQDNLQFKSPLLPKWVTESNDETGMNVTENLNKTTGIEHLISGVADSYKKENILTNFKFTIKRR